MLKVILNRLKPQAEEIIAEEQAWFGVGRRPQNRSSTLESCVKSTSNISKICTMSSLITKEPLAEYGRQPYGPPCGSTNTNANLVRTTEQLYDKAIRAVQMNGSIKEWFRKKQSE